MVAFWLSFSCWQSSRCSGSTGGEEDHTSPPAPPPWQHQPYPPIWEPLPIKVIRQPATGALHFIRDGEKTNNWQRNTRRKKKTPTKQTWADFQTITTGMPSQNLARVQRPLREWCSATQRKQIHQVPTLVPPPLSLSGGTVSLSCRRWFGPVSIPVCHPSGAAVQCGNGFSVCVFQQYRCMPAPWTGTVSCRT